MKSVKALLFVLVFSLTLLAGCTTTTEAPAEDAMMEEGGHDGDAMMEDDKAMEADGEAMEKDGDAMMEDDKMEKDAMMEADVEAEVTAE